MYENDYATNYIVHSGVKGMHWGERRYQNADGSLTALGKLHYGLTGGGRDYITDKMSNASAIRSQQLARSNKSSGVKGAVRAQKSYNYANAALKSYDNSKIVKVANKLGNVSRAIKSKVDYNNDGTFDINDIKSAGSSLKKKVSSKLDTDGNGKIDALEKASSIYGKVKSKVKSGLDYNKDGKVDSNDAKSLYSTGKSKVKSALDKDGNGKIDAVEKAGDVYKTVKGKLTSAYGAASSAISDAYTNAKKYLKTKLDRNSDGSVNTADLKAAASEFVRNAKGAVNDIVSKVTSSSAYKWITDTINSIADSMTDSGEETKGYTIGGYITKTDGTVQSTVQGDLPSEKPSGISDEAWKKIQDSSQKYNTSNTSASSSTSSSQKPDNVSDEYWEELQYNSQKNKKK